MMASPCLNAVIASHPVGAKRRRMTGSAKQSRIFPCEGLLRRFAPRNDGQPHFRVLAAWIRPSLASCSPSQRNEGAGDAGCTPHPRSRVQFALKESAHEHTGEAEAVRHPLRNGFTVYIALSSGSHALLPPSPDVMPKHRRQAWRQRRGAGTTRLRRTRRVPFVSRQLRVHRIPLSTFMTIAKRPSWREQDAAEDTRIANSVKKKFV